MKYVICSGNKVLNHYRLFSSVEDAHEFLIKETKCRSLYSCRLRSLVVKECYSLILYLDGVVKGIDYLIYGCEDYEKEG